MTALSGNWVEYMKGEKRASSQVPGMSEYLCRKVEEVLRATWVSSAEARRRHAGKQQPKAVSSLRCCRRSVGSQSAAGV